MAEAAATQWGCPVYSAGTNALKIRAHIPATLMRRLSIAPVYHAIERNRLWLGFVYGVDHAALRTIEDMTSCQAEPCIITPTECEAGISLLAGRNTEVTFERSASVAEMANIIQSYAFQISAEEARLASCHGYLWARLLRDGHPTDLLFAMADQVHEPPDSFRRFRDA